MKNLIIAAILLFGVNTHMSASDGGNKNTKAEKTVSKSGRIGIGVVITFGHGKNCVNKGVCDIKLDVTLDSKTTGSYDDGTLTLFINAEYVRTTQPDKMQNFIGQSNFVVEEQYTIPRDVSAKLGTNDKLVVKAGSYPMTFKDGVYTVIIGDML